MFYEPKKGHPFSIDPYKSLIFPRPIGWVSTISKKGIPNLAPYSYFNAVADHPPQVMFSEEASISPVNSLKILLYDFCNKLAKTFNLPL